MQTELIKISEFLIRRWGVNGTPPCPQAIRNHLKNGRIPGEQIGKLWYVNWHVYKAANGNDLVNMVLKGAL